MHYHNIHHKEIRQDEKVNKLVSKVQDIRVLMGRNLNMILERGEKFEGLLTRSEDLSKDAQVFKKKAKTAKYMMMRKYYYWSAALMALLVFIIYLITIATCGMRLQHCRREGDNNNSNEESDSSNGEDNNNGDNNGEDGGN